VLQAPLQENERASKQSKQTNKVFVFLYCVRNQRLLSAIPKKHKNKKTQQEQVDI
jgi:hypothetical protein